VINHVDYQELLKFEIEITKVHSGIVYTEWSETPYKQYVRTLAEERLKIKS